MAQYDASRQADIAKMQAKINDPNTPPVERIRAERALYAIKDQSSYKSIQKIRDKMTEAVKNGDRETIEKLSDQAKKIDRDYQ